MPIQKTLTQMEVYGMSVDVEEISNLCQRMEDVIQSVERKIYQLNGKRFNIGSAKEVAKVSKDKIKLCHNLFLFVLQNMQNMFFLTFKISLGFRNAQQQNSVNSKSFYG